MQLQRSDIMYVAIRDCMLGKTKTPVEELKDLGIESVELFVGRDMRLLPAWGSNEQIDISTQKGVAEINGILEEGKISVCALLMGNDFSSESLTGEIDWIMRTVDAASNLSCNTVRIDLAPHREMAEEDFLKRGVKGMKEVIQETESTGVEFGIENHGRVSNNPDFLSRVLEQVGSESLGVTLDTGNFYWYGTPLEKVYDNMEHFASRVKHTHVKNISYPKELRAKQREIGLEYGTYVCPVYEGDIDHKRVAQILKKAGYKGDFCIEDESLGKCSSDKEAFEILLKDADHLKCCI